MVFSTSAKANYEVDILGGSIPGIPAQRLGVPQEVVGRSHVKIKRSLNENLIIFSAPQVSSAVCFLLSPGASFIRFNILRNYTSAFPIDINLLGFLLGINSGATLRVDAGGSLYSPQLWQGKSHTRKIVCRVSHTSFDEK